jgi:hypothetical protein
MVITQCTHGHYHAKPMEQAFKPPLLLRYDINTTLFLKKKKKGKTEMLSAQLHPILKAPFHGLNSFLTNGSRYSQ